MKALAEIHTILVHSFAQISDLKISMRRSKLFWKKVLFRWYFFLIDNVFINFKVFETLFKKNEKFKIYNFDYSSMTSLNGIKKDPEFYHIWLASEYIRYKKL